MNVLGHSTNSQAIPSHLLASDTSFMYIWYSMSCEKGKEGLGKNQQCQDKPLNSNKVTYVIMITCNFSMLKPLFSWVRNLSTVEVSN